MISPWRQMTDAERTRWLLAQTRRLVPFVIVLVAILLSTMPVFAPLSIVPHFGLLLVYLFALYRPSQLPPWAGVPLGLLADLWLGTPLGAQGVVMPLFMLAVSWFDRKVARTSWWVDWLACAPFLIIYQLLLWRLCLFAGPDIPLLPLLTQALATIAVYPLAAFLFVAAQRRWADG